MNNRVLVFGEYGIRNGGENSFLAIAPLLMQSGWELHAAVPADSEFANSLESCGVTPHELSMHFEGQRKSQTEIRAGINHTIRKLNPGLIHCNSLSTSRICGPVTRELGTPSLGYLRDILKLSRQAISDINQLDRIIAVSAATRDWHCERGVDPEKTHVVYNGVDPDIFYPSESEPPHSIRIELQIPADAPLLLYVGQIGIRKGVDELIESFLDLILSIPNARLLIVGQRNSVKQESIDFEQRLVDRVADSGFSQQVHWLGRRTDVPDLMRSATLLVHPARQEPLGRVLLEAAASGLPMVTTRVGGTPEILARPDFEQLMVPASDAEESTRKIIDLLRDPARLALLGSNLRNRALEAFTHTQCGTRLDQHYRELSSDEMCLVQAQR